VGETKRQSASAAGMAADAIVAFLAKLVVSLKELTPSRLSLLLDQVLNDSIYRDKARYFQKVIAETNGLSKAVDLLERAFGLTHNPGYEAASDAGRHQNDSRLFH
jgi:UDP:flavonoid glycosyltransferase YjiC (YdhE family)